MTAAGAGGRIARWSGGPLVGRDDLLDDLATAAEAAARGTDRSCSSPVRRASARPAWRTPRPGRARPACSVLGHLDARPERAPYWPWQTLVSLEATDTAHDTDQTIGAARFERLTELREHVRTAALDQPRLHIIEDLQWADVASVLLLAHVGETIADIPLLVVATLRTGEPRASQLEQAIESVRRSCTARMLPVLDESDLAAMIRAPRAWKPTGSSSVSSMRERAGTRCSSRSSSARSHRPSRLAGGWRWRPTACRTG